VNSKLDKATGPVKLES